MLCEKAGKVHIKFLLQTARQIVVLVSQLLCQHSQRNVLRKMFLHKLYNLLHQ